MAEEVTRVEELNSFCEGLPRFQVGPLWQVLAKQLTPVPETAVKPYLWRWEVIRPELMRAGELVSAAEAERRVLMLLNPGLPGRVATTHTLYAGLQLILPGEVARTHRHTPNALRFVMEGTGAYTVVDGERLPMEPGDFVLTPGWTWHEHGSAGAEPVVWLDGLDLPLSGMMAGTFFEPGERESQTLTKPDDQSTTAFKRGGLLPTWQITASGDSPLLKYSWSEARPALMDLSKDAESPFDGATIEYTNPTNGGPSLKTIASFLHRIRPKQRTQAHRLAASKVYLVVEGGGETMIDGKTFFWEVGDVFAVPTWARHSHVNPSSSRDAILFSFSDAPVMKALGWYREQKY